MRKISLIFIFAIVLTFTFSANAANFMVTNTLDTLDNAPGDGICADIGGFCTLRAAIGEANALAGADTILVQAGTYTTTLVAAAEDANAGGDFDITQNLTITGAGQGQTIVQAALTQGTATERVFHNLTVGVSLTLEKMTIQNGTLTGTAGTNARGGGIRNDGILTLNYVSVLNNSAQQVGGGIYNAGSATLNTVTVSGNLCTIAANNCFGGGMYTIGNTASVSVGNSVFTNNISTATGAGNFSGIAAGFGKQDTGPVTINNSTFSNNTGNGVGTGGSQGNGVRITTTVTTNNTIITNTTISNNIGNTAAGSNHFGSGLHLAAAATIDNVTITGNSGSNAGAGIYISIQPVVITINNSSITNNTLASAAVNNFGAGISLIAASTLTLNNCNITGNSSTATGAFVGLAGGIYNQAGTLVVNSSNISGNTANFHGGIRTLASGASNTATTTLNNSTVNGNSAGEGGGVVNIISATATATTNTNINNSTISGNTATGPGGGVYQFGTGGAGTTNINNSTIASNTANSDNTGATDNGGGLIQTAGTVNFKNTIIADNTVGTGSTGPDCSGTITSADYNLIENTTGCTIAGTTTNNITGVDPALAPLAFNGGFARTHALGSQSLALNAGDPTNCQTIAAVAVTADERGLPRSQGGVRCDMGAFERGGFIWVGALLSEREGKGESKDNEDSLGSANAWNNPSSWQGGVVPGPTDWAIFNSSSSNPAIVTAPAFVGGIIYGAGYTSTLTLNANLTISQGLQMNAGNITATGSNTLIIGGVGTVTRTSGVVIGNMQKQFSGFAPFTFPVGTTVRFLPVTISPSSPLNAPEGLSSFTVKANNYFLPDTNAANSLYSYWTFTPVGIPQADITVVYPDNAVPLTANEAQWQFVRRTGGSNTFIPPTSFNTTTNTFTLNGVTTFSDWGLGTPGTNAAHASVSGRVTTASGAGIRNVVVTVTGGGLNQPISTVTGSFGYYELPDLAVGETYIVTVTAKRYIFNNPSQVVSLMDSITDLNFVADGTVNRNQLDDGK